VTRHHFKPTLVLGLCAAALDAQPNTRARTFDVESIKPAAISAGREGGNRSRIDHTPTSLSMWNVSLSDCMQWACSVAPFQIFRAQLSSDSYDIVAKVESPVSVSELRIMLQDLLRRRFQLVHHRATRMLPAYELAVAKGGPRLPLPNGAAESHVHSTESLPQVENDSFVFLNVSLAEFATMLAKLRGIELPVVDRTGITGTFDLVLKSAPSAAREGDTAALFAIIHEQLGLKIVPSKAPFEVLVIDRAGKPSEN
jgi:uncharacterized protein (TIGR03435 family)